MGLESASYISELDPANPTGSDIKGLGDNHLRLIKYSLKNQFPNYTAAQVLATVAETNYLVGVTSGIQAQLNGKVSALNAALTGVPTAPTAPFGTASTQIATTQFVADQAFSLNLPGQTGHAGEALFTNGTTPFWGAVLPPEQKTRAITLADTAVAADRQKVLAFSGASALALAFDPVASLPDGWYVWLQNASTFAWTLDPSGAETIDGAATAVMQPGEIRLVRSTGTALFSLRIPGNNVMYARDEKTTGTSGGASVATTWNARTLNTVVHNTIAGATLSASQVTLAQPGLYEIEASAPARSTDGHQLRLYNVTGAAVLLVGATAYAANADSTTTRATLRGRITIAASTVLRLDHYTSAVNGNGLGIASGSGATEVYAELTIRKVA